MYPPDPIHLVFLGCGRITRRHARTLRSYRDVRFSFASRSLERATTFSRELGGSRAFGSYDEALGSPDVDVALVATPPDSHLSLTLHALALGKHVIVEKPAFVRASECLAVADAALSANRRVFVAENYRYKPVLRTLRDLVETDTVGEIRLVHLNALKWQRSPPWINGDANNGMGALFEGGIHWLHFLASLGPVIESVRGFRSEGSSSPERGMVVVARYAGGAVGTLCHSWETPSPLRGIRMSYIHGARGVISFESNGLFVRVTGPRPRIIFPGLRDIAGYRGMFRDFLTALRDGHEPAMTLSLAHRDLALVEAAYRTDEAGVTLAEVA